MPLHCVVRSCPTTRLRGTATETSLHQFPKDPILRDKWIRFARPGNKNWRPFTSSAICSLHFKTEESDGVLMKKFGYRTRIFLKPGAIPTINPPPCRGRFGEYDDEEEVETSPKKKTFKKADSNNTDKLIHSSLLPLEDSDSDVQLLKDKKDNYSPSLPRFKNLVSHKKSKILKAVRLLERSTPSITSCKKKVKGSKKLISLPIDVQSGEVHTNQPPKQAQFPSKHFVGGNGPTRDHPDPLPVRPMNMLPSMVGYAEAGPSNQAYSGKPENSRRKKIATATISSETVLIPDDSPPQPTAPKLQKKQFDERRFDDQRFVERRFENRRFEERRQMTASQSAQVTPPSLQHPSQMQVQQHLQVAAPPPPQAPPPQRQVQVLAPPVQVPVAKPKPVEKPRPREKRIFVVADHQRCVMSNLSSLWKSGKLCDAGIGNGSSTVMVHKVVLSAVCPKLLSVFSTDILSHKFLQVNFPEEVSTEALNAFAEYMYNGILDLDRDILEQLKIIAKRLDMKEFEQLCDSHLPNHMHQPSAAATSSFTHIPLIQTSMPIPDITSSLVSPITTSIQSAPSITTQVIDVKQEITDAELAQVQKDTAAVFGQESAVSSLAPNKSGSAAGFVICPSIKTEPVGPDDNRYGCLTSSNDQVFTSTTSSSQPTATASYTSVSSVPASSTEYSINFSQSTDVKSTRLKVSHTYETPLVSDLSPVSRIVQTVCSQSSAIKEDSSKTLTRQQPTSSIELPLTSSNNSGIYPVGLFTAAGANLPLLTTETVDVKTIDLYKTDLT